MGIVNGSSRTLSQTSSSVPNVSEALDGWFKLTSVSTIVKTVVDYQTVETVTTKNIIAVLQPFTSRQLVIKPEGQRAWAWYTLHVKDSDDFALDDIITISSVKYRIMQKFEWKDYGYFEYQVIQGFQT